MFAVVLWETFSAKAVQKNNRLIQPEGDGQWREPQRIFIALAELKTLLNEGRTMLAKYQRRTPSPTRPFWKLATTGKIHLTPQGNKFLA